MTGACESSAMVSGKFPLVMPNWPNVSTTGINPDLDKPAPTLTMFASAIPTSIKRSGKLFWNRLMPVEPCTSAETEVHGQTFRGRAYCSLGQTGLHLSPFSPPEPPGLPPPPPWPSSPPRLVPSRRARPVPKPSTQPVPCRL